jgi:hypothetical protein
MQPKESPVRTFKSDFPSRLLRSHFFFSGRLLAMTIIGSRSNLLMNIYIWHPVKIASPLSFQPVCGSQ